MADPDSNLRRLITQRLEAWHRTGLPSHDGLKQAAAELAAWKTASGVNSLWESQPHLLTATLDDAWGHGLEIIQLWAETVGLRVTRLGLMQSPDQILTACRRLEPDLLGLTALRDDAADDLIQIRRQLPPHIKLIAGGPIFKYDPTLAETIGLDSAARNVADFLSYLLTYRR